jgi:hypothetical protein
MESQQERTPRAMGYQPTMLVIRLGANTAQQKAQQG